MAKGVIADASTADSPRRRSGVPLPTHAALTIASHTLAHRVGERCVLDALAAGKEVALARNTPDFVKPGRALGMSLADPFVSRKPIRLVPRGEGRIQILIDEGGTAVTAGAPIHRLLEIGPGELLAGVPLELADRVVLLLHQVVAGEERTRDALGMIGESAGIRRVRAHVERLADLHVPVLLRGETGTGKELVARALHDHGPRRGGPFVSVNLGAVPRELAAAELFGAQKGAYTGATRDREGFFRAARGGTLFLDEVGEASPEVQAMLLRVLETGEMYPVGGQAPVATDARILAATDADLDAQIRDGHFKAPLLHRLAGYEIRLPPLRERREDIGVLFYHFAREELSALGEAHRLSPEDPYTAPWMPASLMARLLRFAWPGNIRQLRNLTRQLVIGSRGSAQVTLDPRLLAELGEELAPPAGPGRPAQEPPGKPRRRPSEIGEAELLAALRESAWDLKGASDRLGIPRSSIYDVIDRYPGIRTAGDLDAAEIEQCYEACGGDLDAMVQRLQVSERALKRRLKELGLEGRRA
ncbi:sigma 54-interacting transcriptional regulator [Sorangium cellulosum]|uniref:sigma 54-interacting transcriptional regulator n=1 Tax=Sorangium cellulosum TaxID=56 RepID=UPI0005D134DC